MVFTIRYVPPAVLVCVCCAGPVDAQISVQPGAAATANQAEPAADGKAGKVLRALRVEGTSPRIDGQLDDESWQRAESAEGFIQWEPDNMAPLSERTVVQVAYDDRYVYVAVRCYDREPEGVKGPLSRRDEARGTPTDLISIGFDPRHDHLTGYVFTTNPAGVQNDFFFFNDENTNRDYDAVWEVHTSRDSEGWVAEFRIPFSQMRFNRPAGARRSGDSACGATSIARASSVEWTGRPRGERGNVSRWGHLVFAMPLSPPRRLEVLPYAMARHEGSSGRRCGRGGRRRRRSAPRARHRRPRCPPR